MLFRIVFVLSMLFMWFTNSYAILTEASEADSVDTSDTIDDEDAVDNNLDEDAVDNNLDEDAVDNNLDEDVNDLDYNSTSITSSYS